jgi:hypothetical protein
MSWGWCSLSVGDLWVSDASSNVLFSLFSLDGVVWDDDGLDDVNRVSSGTVSTGHFTVHLGDGSAKTVVSVLLVHVDNIGSGVILENNTVVSDSVGRSLKDLTDGNDLSLGSSDLVLSLHLIPESGSSDNSVLCEDSDSVAGWLWLSLAWTLSSNDPILVDLYITKTTLENSYNN